MLRISMKKTAAAAAVTFAFVAGSLVQTSPIAPITYAQAQQAQLPDFTKLVEDNGKAVVSIQVTQKAAVRKNANPFKGMPKDKLDELRRFGFPFPFPGPDRTGLPLFCTVRRMLLPAYLLRFGIKDQGGAGP